MTAQDKRRVYALGLKDGLDTPPENIQHPYRAALSTDTGIMSMADAYDTPAAVSHIVKLIFPQKYQAAAAVAGQLVLPYAAVWQIVKAL